MAKTFNRVKSNLIDILRNKENSVVVLKGKWGTGKTYLWRKVEEELYPKNRTTKKPIYVSLFGAKTIKELKLRILQNAYLKDASGVQKIIKTSGDFITQFIKRATGYSTEDGLLLWLPDLVGGRLIVIDDIERKHKSLDIDELLGLIDEYSDNHKTQFLVLLNTDKLEDVSIWKAMHEKVIDSELILEPSASESFDIAVANLNASTYLPEIKSAISILNVNNIRIIERVLKTIQYIVNKSEFDDIAPSRWIPSTVLMVSSHFHGIDNPPTIEFIKSYNQYSRMFNEQNEQAVEHAITWGVMLDQLGIHYADEYESLLLEYLQSGLLDVSKLKLIFARYKKDTINDSINEQLNEFLTAYLWDASRDENDLLVMANDMLSKVNDMVPMHVTNIFNIVDNLDPHLAKRFIEDFLPTMEMRSEYLQLGTNTFEGMPYQNFHPDIIAKLIEMRDRQQPLPTLNQAVENVFKSGFTGIEMNVFRSATNLQYEDALKEIKNDELKHFMSLHLPWVSEALSDSPYKNAADSFVTACVKIYSENPTSRLSEIIHREFEKYRLTEKLFHTSDVADSNLS